MNFRLTQMTVLIFFAAVFFAPFSRCAAQESRRQKQEQSQQQTQYRDEGQSVLQDQQQTESQSYAGTISQKHGKYYLELEFHKSTFELQNTWETNKFLGKKVRVTGVLDAERNILRVIAITAIPK